MNPSPHPAPMVLLSHVPPALLRCALACVLAWMAMAAPARPQAAAGAADDLAILYNQAIQAFNASNWGAAASGLEKFISSVPEDKQAQIQGTYYTLGAAYFNAKNHAKAIETFKKYLTKFPNGEKTIEVKLGIAQASMAGKNYEEAVSAFKAIEAIPQFRDQALMAQAMAYKELGKLDLAMGTLERLISPEIKTSVQATGAVTLAQMYAEKKQAKKAVDLLGKLQRKTELIENLVSLNNVAVKLGDDFLGDKSYAEALSAYRAVRTREEVMKFQSSRIAYIDKRMEANLKGAVGNPPLLAQAQMANSLLKEEQKEQKEFLEKFEALPDFAPALLFRIGRCWYEWEKRWEAITVYDRLLTRFPDAKAEREPSLFAMILAYADVNQPKRTQELCLQYMKDFPDGPNNGTVGYMTGAVSLQAGDYAGAESFFGIMIDKVSEASFKEEMRFLLGNAKFMQGKYEEAIKDYTRYVSDYPAGGNVEDATYRIAVCNVFLGNYEVALGQLNAYLTKYPQGLYAGDGKYRVAVCYYAANEFDTVIEKCTAFRKEHPGDPITGEVLSLLGDAEAAKNHFEEAVKAYRESVKMATIEEVVNYSLFEASKYLQKLGQWEEVAKMFTEFVKEKPDHTSTVAAMFWIGKARARLGQTEEAKAIMVENLKKYIAEPKREAVEQLLMLLAQLCQKRPKAAPLPAPEPPPAPIVAADPKAPAPPPVPVATPPPLPPYDAIGALDAVLKQFEEGANGTTKSRLIYCRIELLKLLKKNAEADDLMREIAERFKPEELSPVLLAQAGEFVLSKKETDKAVVLFEHLRENHPKSEYLDWAFWGLGEIAFEKKQYEPALKLFTDALDNSPGSGKMKDSTLGKAKTLMELKRYDEAKKLFEQVASIREWRGDSTAYAVYSLGEIEARQGKWNEAIAYYRRVFLAYQKYLPWVAKSYIKTADSFEKLGKRQDAIDNLKEMLRNEKLQKLPETREARERLAEWGVSVG